eukprot:756726-Hanusia_phi.AAC.4
MLRAACARSFGHVKVKEKKRTGSELKIINAQAAMPTTRIACQRFSSSTGNTITPKVDGSSSSFCYLTLLQDEYSGRASYEVPGKAKDRVHPAASPLHHVYEPVGEVRQRASAAEV